MIEIVDAELTTEDEGQFWACVLEISQGAESYGLPANAPGTLTENELQAHFDAKEAELWPLAQAKGYAADIFERVAERRVLKAFALVVLDEINILRVNDGLAERTADQIVTAIKAKLRG